MNHTFKFDGLLSEKLTSKYKKPRFCLSWRLK